MNKYYINVGSSQMKRAYKVWFFICPCLIRDVEKTLCEIPLPEETELIESLSQAGKLTGNGNGMQYFGAILIRSDLSLEELDAYYSRYRSNEWECLVKIQEGQSIEGIDHGTLQFAEEIKDRGYYIVYSWGSGNSLLDELDIRGH